ncbi:MAG: sigma-70 family RNA polymerase sigma factor [Roseovarius sp.]
MDDAEIEDLIARLARGDREAFDRLYSAVSGQLFGLCIRVLRDRALAEDALQEAWVRIWRNAGRYRRTGASPKAWLVTLTRNVAIDRLRAERGAAMSGTDDGAEASIAGDDPTPERITEARGELRRLAECLGELPADRSAALRGAYLDGASYAELAERFRVPLNTMRSWLRRGLIALKECMDR